MDQLEENFKAFAQPFSSADEKILALQLDHIRPMYCRMCGECDGQCRKGLPVADVLRFLTYADGYGQFALGRERFLGLDAGHTAVRGGDCPVHRAVSLWRPCGATLDPARDPFAC
jgi:hypothetical protein